MDTSHASTIKAANASLLAGGDLAAIDRFFTPGYVAHGTLGDLRGPSGVRSFLDALHAAFSDLEVEVEILVEAEDRIAWRRFVRGTHTSGFRSFRPSHRSLRWCDMVTSRLEDGRIAEEWVVTDLAEQLLRARTD